MNILNAPVLTNNKKNNALTFTLKHRIVQVFFNTVNACWHRVSRHLLVSWNALYVRETFSGKKIDRQQIDFTNKNRPFKRIVCTRRSRAFHLFERSVSFFSRFSVRRWSVKRSVYGPINSPHLENINRYIRQQHQNIFQMLLNLQVYEINSTWLVFLYHFASVCLHSFRIYCGMKSRKHTEKKKPHRFDIRERKIHYKTFDSDRKNGANDEISLFEITHSFHSIDIQFVRVRLWLYFHVFSVLFLSSS